MAIFNTLSPSDRFCESSRHGTRGEGRCYHFHDNTWPGL